jgi:hypothetical protein
MEWSVKATWSTPRLAPLGMWQLAQSLVAGAWVQGWRVWQDWQRWR